MAVSLNKVFLIGNLTRDPELKYIPSGQAVANFSIAVNRTFVGTNGEKKEETSFVKIVVWGKIAEICNEYLKKGRSVCVEGRLQSRSWQTEDGQKRSTMEVVAHSVQFLDRGKSVQNGEKVAINESDSEGSIPQVTSVEDEVPF